MPFKSSKQRAFLESQKPAIAKKFEVDEMAKQKKKKPAMRKSGWDSKGWENDDNGSGYAP